MAQEENSYGGGGGICRSKKIKPKKVPQRGLGVAQLEKIIVEQHKESTSFLAVKKFRPNLSPFDNSIPLPPPSSQPNLSSPNALFSHTQLAPNIEILQENSSVSTKGNLPRIWSNGESNHGVEKQRLDHHGFSFDPHHFQPPPPSIVQSGISPSSVLSSHLEPPSNQRPNNYASQWTEQDKMVGMKRVYPFYLESPSAPSLLNFHPSYASSLLRPDDLALCSSGSEYRNKCIRGSLEVVADDESLTGDFLTLAPPYSNLKHNQYSDNECRTSKEYVGSQGDDPVKESFNFFPIKLSNNPSINDVRNGNNDKCETIDLSLKL